MQSNSNSKKWTDYYNRLNSLMYPNEYVLRILVGNYPDLNLNLNGPGKNRRYRILDASCGDGRNMRLLHGLDLDVVGSEITEEICQKVRKNLCAVGVPESQIDVRVGDNENLPSPDSTFDYLLSWNAIYYLNSRESDIRSHVAEFSRVLRQGGKLICSVPTPRCYSLVGAEEIKKDVVRLNPKMHATWGDGVLESAVFYSFKDSDHVESVFGPKFQDFRFGFLSDDCFGLPLDYILFVCSKK